LAEGTDKPVSSLELVALRLLGRARRVRERQ